MSFYLTTQGRLRIIITRHTDQPAPRPPLPMAQVRDRGRGIDQRLEGEYGSEVGGGDMGQRLEEGVWVRGLGAMGI